jgi:hypothetical protein
MPYFPPDDARFYRFERDTNLPRSTFASPSRSRRLARWAWRNLDAIAVLAVLALFLLP